MSILDAQLPERLPLAMLPTPIRRVDPGVLARLLAANGATADRSTDELPAVWIKRDDLTGLLLSGNKVRKLEYALAEARSAGATHVVTCGGLQSNHCRATAVCCAALGMQAVLLLRMDDPDVEPELQGNVLIDRLVGARVVRFARSQWPERNAIMQAVADELSGDGHTPYIVPEGASNAVGALGYVNCVREIGLQLAETVGDGFDTIVVACGSGGTAAGLDLGLALYPHVARKLRALAVCDDVDYFRQVCTNIYQAAVARLGLGGEDGLRDAPVVDLDDRFIGAGYAIPYPAMMADLAALARATGIVLDPVYSGKAWHGMLQTLRDNPSALGSRVCFIHTGGVYGLFAQGDHLLPHLPPLESPRR
ncbi:MAG: 1-aminocyclopropane-1-carboxylate deaminase/D-cysteine desulfhydrase [Planctomycetota bacterium]